MQGDLNARVDSLKRHLASAKASADEVAGERHTASLWARAAGLGRLGRRFGREQPLRRGLGRWRAATVAILAEAAAEQALARSEASARHAEETHAATVSALEAEAAALEGARASAALEVAEGSARATKGDAERAALRAERLGMGRWMARYF